jgi:asparagine synthase (glutamine-hydrolysing)
MCGICGFLQPGGSSKPDLEHRVSLMATAIKHRGPDDDGIWVDAECGLAFGFRRLAILDLSAKGHQPMFSADARFTIIYNGEVYNYQELRTELEQKGYGFNGQSDTEVMLAAFSEWGVRAAVERFNGMFAIALWDSRDQQLYLLRDRAGVKPLFYGWNNGVFFFGSELKALKAHPRFAGSIDQGALAQYFKYGYVPAPQSIYEGIYKLPPGSLIALDPRKPGEQLRVEAYWHLERVTAKSARFAGDDHEALDELERLLKESVRLRMISDVPLGAFLSGGVDSSAVVALMQAQSSLPVRTFTIGFREQRFNEAEHARMVAEHLGTEHTELYVTPEQAMAVIPRLPQIYDEPFADSSQIPTFLVSELARQQVTVSLSGDGGDELFLGYNRYRWAQQLWNSTRWLPKPGRALLHGLTRAVSPARWDTMLAGSGRRLAPQFGDKLQKLGSIVMMDRPDEIYEQLVTFWPDSTELLTAEHAAPQPVNGYTRDQLFAEWMSWTDLHTYLPDDILVKLDRASMAVSLEARVPLLDDHRVVEFAARLPYSMKYRRGSTKWLLRKLLYRYVPANLIERPKMGFGVPIDAWLRGPLHQWAADLLEPRKLEQAGLHSEPVQQKWREHLSGSRNWQYHLWNVLMFQAWFTHQN